jgi:hypothetical protein
VGRDAPALAPRLLAVSIMPRNHPPTQTRDPEDDKPEPGGAHLASARMLRHDADDVDDDEEDFGDEDFEDEDFGDEDFEDDYEARTIEAARAAQDGGAGKQGAVEMRPWPSSRGDDDADDDDAYDACDDEPALTEADVMQAALDRDDRDDRDDRKKLEGPDA